MGTAFKYNLRFRGSITTKRHKHTTTTLGITIRRQGATCRVIRLGFALDLVHMDMLAKSQHQILTRLV